MTTQKKYAPGMKELSDIVAGLYKDVKLMKECSWLGGAQKFASKHNGWIATKEDLTGPEGVPDGVDEILIRDKDGNIRVVNGYTLKPSHHALRQAYYTEVPRNDDKTLRDLGYEPDTLQYKMRLGRPKKGMTMKQYKHNLYEYNPVWNPDGTPTGEWKLNEFSEKLPKAAVGLRNMSKPSPFKIFGEWLHQLWQYYAQNNAETFAAIPADVKLRVHNLWSHLEYLNRIVVPVFQQMGIDYNSLPYREDVTKYTNRAEFKQRALLLLQQLLVDGEKTRLEEEFLAELAEFFNRGLEYANTFEYQSKPPKPPELKRQRNQA